MDQRPGNRAQRVIEDIARELVQKASGSLPSAQKWCGCWRNGETASLYI